MKASVLYVVLDSDCYSNQFCFLVVSFVHVSHTLLLLCILWITYSYNNCFYQIFFQLTLKINCFFQPYCWEVGRKPTALRDNCYDFKQHAGIGMLVLSTMWFYMFHECWVEWDSLRWISLRWLRSGSGAQDHLDNHASIGPLSRVYSMVALMHHDPSDLAS